LVLAREVVTGQDRPRLARLVREPLLHFFVLGAALFGLYHFASARSPVADRILVTVGTVRTLAETFRLTWQRPPTRSELDGLIANYVREEVLVREARRLGLDQDDTVVRRRLRTKMDILADDMAGISRPTDAQLQDFLDRHANAFRVDGRLSFSHVYLSPERHGQHLDAVVARVGTQLRKVGVAAKGEEFGDPILLDAEFDALPEREAARLFGDEFERALADASLGAWSGPVRSGYGLHFVLVRSRTAGRLARLDEVREAVEREWLNAETVRARDAFFERLRSDVQVEVEPEKGDAASMRVAQ
jgi:hypothetical protein